MSGTAYIPLMGLKLEYWKGGATMNFILKM